jgi:hypothetical protein
MTEYETLSVFNGLSEQRHMLADSIDTGFQFWLTATFAAVTAAYIVGVNITRPLQVVILTLYVGATLFALTDYIVTLFALFNSFANVAHLIEARPELLDVLPPNLLVVWGIFLRFSLFVLGGGATIYFILTARNQRSILAPSNGG